jgi:hypothetical protein
MNSRINYKHGIIFPVLVFLFFFCEKLPAQKSVNNDAQFWENINAEKSLSRNFTARFSHEGRFTSNDSRLTYFYGDFGAEYQIPKTHFGIMLDYVFIRKLSQKLQMPEYWSTRHQFYTAITWKHKFGKAELHDRQMILAQVKDVRSSADGKIPDWYLRNKITVKYNFNYYWSAYAAEELYWHMITPSPDALPHTNRMRYFIGGFYKPNRRNEFELYYLVEQHMHINNPNHNFVIGAGYTLSL